MGLLSRLTAKSTPPRQMSDDALLLHAMLLMCGADGAFDQEEIATVEAYFAQLPEFRGKQFSDVYNEAIKILRKYPDLKASVQSLGSLSTQGMKKKCYVLAADIAMSSGDVDENEDAMLESMQRVMQIDDDFATKALEILAVKYQPAE